jgi:hypothetical protein
MLRIGAGLLPKGCANHSGQSPDVKAKDPFSRGLRNVTGFPAFGEG